MISWGDESLTSEFATLPEIRLLKYFPGVQICVYAYSMDGGRGIGCRSSSQMQFVTNFNQLQAEQERATEQTFSPQTNGPSWDWLILSMAIGAVCRNSVFLD